MVTVIKCDLTGSMHNVKSLVFFSDRFIGDTSDPEGGYFPSLKMDLSYDAYLSIVNDAMKLYRKNYLSFSEALYESALNAKNSIESRDRPS